MSLIRHSTLHAQTTSSLLIHTDHRGQTKMTQKLQLLGLEVQHMIKSRRTSAEFPVTSWGHHWCCFLFCFEYMDKGDWWATVHGVTKSWMQLSILTWHLKYISIHQGILWNTFVEGDVIGDTEMVHISKYMCPLSWND